MTQQELDGLQSKTLEQFKHGKSLFGELLSPYEIARNKDSLPDLLAQQ